MDQTFQVSGPNDPDSGMGRYIMFSVVQSMATHTQVSHRLESRGREKRGHTLLVDGVAPPVELDLGNTGTEPDEDDSEGSADIETSSQDIVVLKESLSAVFLLPR